ncbi:MAG: ParA family protein [Planctomycetota bacterium]
MMIAVVNQKGGAGKTTLAVHLAVHLFDQGKRVALLDNDPQQSASRWIGRAEPGVTCASVLDAKTLVDQVQELEATHDVLIADGAPRLNEQTHVLMYFARRILIPTRPTTLDLQATIETKQAIDTVQAARLDDGRTPIDVALLLNFVRTVGNLHTTVRQALRAMDYPLASSAISMRDAVAKAVTLQSTVTRMAGEPGADKGSRAAARDFLNVFNEVLPHELRNDSHADTPADADQQRQAA